MREKEARTRNEKLAGKEREEEVEEEEDDTPEAA